jgi:hypothetical protein
MKMLHYLRMISRRRHATELSTSSEAFIVDPLEVACHQAAAEWFNRNVDHLRCSVDEVRGSLLFDSPFGRVTFALDGADAEQFYALTRLGSPMLFARVAANGMLLVCGSLERWNLYITSRGARLELWS